MKKLMVLAVLTIGAVWLYTAVSSTEVPDWENPQVFSVGQVKPRQP